MVRSAPAFIRAASSSRVMRGTDILPPWGLCADAHDTSVCMRKCYTSRMAGARGEDPRLAAWRALLLAHAGSLRAIEADLAEEGTISLWWYDVLLELEWAPEHRLRMQELGARGAVLHLWVSCIVDELVDASRRKSPDPGDGRATLAASPPPADGS